MALLLKSNIRLLVRNKQLAIVKMTGLTIGSAIFMLTSLYCWNELQYDQQHRESERIYRYVHRVNTPEGMQSFAFTSATTGPALKERFMEVEDFCRVFRTNASVRNVGADISFNEKKFGFADPSFLTFFNFPLQGNSAPNTVLQEPLSVIITTAMAIKYFGDQDPIGKRILFNNEITFIVRGVFQSDLKRTHFDLDFVASFGSLDVIKNHPTVSRQIPASLNLDAKGFNTFYTYLKLLPQTTPVQLERKFPAFIEDFRGEGKSERLKPVLQSLNSIHLHSNLLYEMAENGSAQIVYVYFIIGTLVLLIACINYINITTAEFIKRARGIGLKKILGINRGTLIISQLFETGFLTSISLLIGAMIAYLVLPAFNTMTDRQVEFITIETMLIVAGIFIATTFLSGLYPAVNITKADALQSFQGHFKGNSSAYASRQALVFFQLLISFCLVTLSLLIYQQLDFLIRKDPGFDSNQIITLNATAATPLQRITLKNRLLSDENVINATMCSIPPGESLFSYGITLPENDGDDERRLAVYQSFVDSDFIATLGIKLSEGRFFDPSNASDSTRYLVLNETAAEAIGEPILNREVKIPGVFTTQEVSKSVIGIIEDFNFASLRQDIQPLLLEYNPDRCRYLLIRFRDTNASEALGSIEGAWREILSTLPFDYHFMDETFAKFYDQEQRQKKIITSLALVAISLAALGIFGTTLFVIEQRTKEVGIRKVLGSQRTHLLWLLLRSSFTLIVTAGLTGVPLSLAAGTVWLEQYAYRMQFPPVLFLIAFFILLSVVTMTMLHGLLRLTRVNPTDVLRHVG